ncbi:hypothetical protein P879_01960 [Paragonimus westermani]|uniref:GCF C-terminal domain-containing protein n=1 Tax=Paragonimus westermani TaxID=34504 RepID=A0A8T0DKB1_9TREM|nr:hypothetical protein P879_01960 [Paragonimus westermani]
MSDLFVKNARRAHYRSKADQSDDESLYEPESLYEQGAKEIICGQSSSTPGGCGTVKKVRSVLSFEDDLDPDDGDVFKVKKTNMSRRLTKQTKDQKKHKKQTDSDLPKVVNRREVVERRAEKEDPVASEEKLERLRRQLLDLNDDEDSVSEQPGSSLLKKGAIPDAATIHLARKQREKAKNMMESMEPAESNTRLRGSGDGKRLIREEDDDDEEDVLDEPGGFGRSTSTYSGERRPAFVVSDARDTIVKRPGIGTRLKRREAELESIRSDFLAAEHGSDHDSDQDGDWERQQIQKAMITQNPAVLEAIQPIGRLEDSATSAKTDPLFAGLNACNLTLPNLKSSLQNKFTVISASLASHEASLKDAKADLERGRKVISDCREKLPLLARKFTFAQEMKTYVDDLVECFNEKMSKLEYLERRTNILYRERYTKLVERRRMDMKDMADLATQPTPAPNSISSKTPEEAKQLEARRRRCAERESRRIRRQRVRELSITGSNQMPAAHLDGTSTDDEEPQAVIVKRKADIDAILVDARAIFEDVVEEFCELPLILQRFADWHTNFPESYAEAYVALCLPQLFSPIVRGQLVGWNPLSMNADSLEQMDWFHVLLDFTCLPMKTEFPTNGTTMETDPVDADLKVLPFTVEKIVLERLNDVVAASWDPLSHRESVRLVSLIRKLTNDYPSVCIGSRPTEQLFATIVKRIEVTIQEDIFIPLYPKHLMQNRQGAAFLFFERQLRIGMKLFKNILLWHNLISTEALQHVSLICLVNRYLLVGLASLLSVATSSISKNNSSDNEKPNVVISLSSVMSLQQVAVLAFQDAVNQLAEMVDVIPSDWLSCGNNSCVKREEQQSVMEKTTPDAFAQLRRFVAQLLEHLTLSPSSTSHVPFLQVNANLEREWTTTLKRLQTRLTETSSD